MRAPRLPLPRLLRDKRVQFALVILLIFVATMLLIASRYGEDGIEVVDGQRRVQTEGERCTITLPDGWSWRPASWTAVSPLGTNVGFSETVYGRPENPEWEDEVDLAMSRFEGQPGIEVMADEDTLRVDFGDEGGLSHTQRFDRAGCRLTFSYVEGARVQELETWEAIIASLERNYPGRPAEE
jgi:hypothetical protein